MTQQRDDKGVVVMVDVYAPTFRLADAFLRAGYGCVRVQSTPEVPWVYRSSFSVDKFSDNIVHCCDMDQTVAAVAKHDPVAVITGGELGVELADRISELLGLPTNGSTHSEARRNKHIQIETIKAAGLRGARQLLVTSEDELTDWHRAIGGRVVVKPIRSAGNDGVSFCDTPAESVAAYRAVVDQTNIFSIRNEGVVAQEYLFGTEYAVNTVSRDGHHRATDMWRYIKMSANGVRNYVNGAFFVPPSDRIWEQLTEYAFAVLDALGVRHGPAHLEVMLTPEGPCLVEVGVRLCGADTAYYANLAAGESQVGWTVDAYVHPERFLAGYRAPRRVERYVAMAFLASPVSGVLKSYPLLDRVEALESFHNLQMTVKPGDRLPLTIDDCSEPLMVGLAHPVEAVVAHDFNTICYLDGLGFYELAPEKSES